MHQLPFLKYINGLVLFSQLIITVRCSAVILRYGVLTFYELRRHIGFGIGKRYLRRDA